MKRFTLEELDHTYAHEFLDVEDKKLLFYVGWFCRLGMEGGSSGIQPKEEFKMSAFAYLCFRDSDDLEHEIFQLETMARSVPWKLAVPFYLRGIERATAATPKQNRSQRLWQAHRCYARAAETNKKSSLAKEQWQLSCKFWDEDKDSETKSRWDDPHDFLTVEAASV